MYDDTVWALKFSLVVNSMHLDVGNFMDQSRRERSSHENVFRLSMGKKAPWLIKGFYYSLL